MPARIPPLRIREIGGRTRLGLEGFGDVDGATLQEAADALSALASPASRPRAGAS